MQQAQMEYARKQEQESEAIKDRQESSTSFSIEEKMEKPKGEASFPKLKAMFNKEREKPKKEEQKKISYLFLYTFFISGILITGYLLSSYGHVNHVHVRGDTQIPEQLIIDASHITSQKTMLGVITSEESITKEIKEELPQIKKVEINWQGLNDISLSVSDFQTIAYIETEMGYQNVLETGIILKDIEKIPRGSKIILKNFEDDLYLDTIVTELNTVSEEIQNSISDINYTGNAENPYTILLFMNDGNQIKANLKDFSNKISYYPDILNQIGEQKGTIDMEVGVFFQPFDKGENTKDDKDLVDLEIEE
ncbi:FtsQ-type POTRA domain-containing protein [Jeotgalibaca sp. MA1X17-3]|uniref:cell division protein FtsQ/DivIB n=1 Tax=Jeotgalibaca sp. MA1X17-3 TaxID=2908211 RepID=UPI001F480C17|nr:cell division protein FtsQ/DivIB [Jeotgalibaca sp. MA1X17-3]UJF15124.1 FtsQ-type POTRA domain-containing protein [Jeotgalibaca sp. MA1X17-3]